MGGTDGCRLAALLAVSATAYAAVKLAGAAYLIGMGIGMLWRSRADAADPDAGSHAALGRPVRSGLLTNVLNPKIAVFYTSLLPSLVPVGGAARLWLPVLVATHALLSLAWLSAYAALLGRSTSLLAHPRVRVMLDRMTGCVLVAIGFRVATQSR